MSLLRPIAFFPRFLKAQLPPSKGPVAHPPEPPKPGIRVVIVDHRIGSEAVVGYHLAAINIRLAYSLAVRIANKHIYPYVVLNPNSFD